MASLNPTEVPQANGRVPLNALTADSQAFSFIEYFMRLCLHATTARIVNAWEVSNPQLTLQFEKRAKDVLTLDTWLDLTTLPGEPGEEEIIRRGLQQSPSGSGVKFAVGRLRLEQEKGNNANGNGSREGIVRKRMLLCKIAVGRAYNATEDFAKIAAIPDGYDSFVIDQECVQLNRPLEEAPTTVLSNMPYQEYVIKDMTQILPTYVVVFEFDLEAERRSRQKLLCDNCEHATATVFCQADTANLCATCDVQMHASKLASRHLRTPLEAGPQTFSACRHHSDKLVEFFCPTCSRPVCVHCKMVGHHSTGDAARHKLITVSEAFRSVSEASKATDPLLEARKQRIRAQTCAVVDRARAIEANAAEVQQQLEEIYKRALCDLKNITKKKLNILRGDMAELYREAGEIGQLEAFLEYQQNGGNATQFILDWSHHQRLRGELHSFTHFREAIDVLPDIKINGAIQVHVDAAGLPPMSSGGGGAIDMGNAGGMIGAMDLGSSALRHSTILDPSRPRYVHSSTRSRASPTIDYSTLTKTRKPTDMTLADSIAAITIDRAASPLGKV